ncbi:MAG: peptidase C39 family protein [Caldilineaceae bacterium]
MSQFSFVLLPVAHVQQRGEGDCLVACVDMVLKYLNAPMNYQRLFKALRVNDEAGTPFPNIQRLERLGITVVFRRGSLLQLYKFLQNGWPVIVPVKTQELPHWEMDTDHAVVVVGMDNQFVYLNDPAFPDAPIRVSHGDFDLAWLERDEYYAVLSP